MYGLLPYYDIGHYLAVDYCGVRLIIVVTKFEIWFVVDLPLEAFATCALLFACPTCK